MKKFTLDDLIDNGFVIKVDDRYVPTDTVIIRFQRIDRRHAADAGGRRRLCAQYDDGHGLMPVDYVRLVNMVNVYNMSWTEHCDPMTPAFIVFEML